VDLLEFFAAARLLIVAGKGGVGKTTVTAALASSAARVGLRTLVVEVEGKSGLPTLLGHHRDLGYQEQVFATGMGPSATGELRARTITPGDALVDYLEDHGLRRLSNRLTRMGVLDIVATAAPGIDDILVLGKVKQLERLAAADLIVLDAPAAGHAITFLHSARALLDTVSVGPINTQASDVLDMLSDPTRTQVLLVTLPEETPVNELVDTAFALEDQVGLSLGPVVVNGLYPDLDGLEVDPVVAARDAGTHLYAEEASALAAAASFRSDRLALQHEQVERLAAALPLPQVRLPFLFTADLSPVDVDALSHAFATGLAELRG
jgi:anion-transporting  ArsA/GET3 family ATPase